MYNWKGQLSGDSRELKGGQVDIYTSSVYCTEAFSNSIAVETFSQLLEYIPLMKVHLILMSEIFALTILMAFFGSLTVQRIDLLCDRERDEGLTPVTVIWPFSTPIVRPSLSSLNLTLAGLSWRSKSQRCSKTILTVPSIRLDHLLVNSSFSYFFIMNV